MSRSPAILIGAALVVTACSGVPPIPEPSAADEPRATPALDLADLPDARVAHMRIEADEYPGAVMVRDLRTGTERMLTDAGYPVAMTRDGSSLFVAEAVEAARERLLLYPISGGQPEELLDAVFMAHAWPTLSPDGRWVALASDAAMPHGLVVLDLDEGTATELTHDGAYGTPEWSPDSRWIAYEVIRPGTGSIDVFVASVTGGPPRVVSEQPATEAAIGWTDEGAVIVEREGETDASGTLGSTVAVDIETGETADATAPTPSPMPSPLAAWMAQRSVTLSILDDALFATSADGEWELWSVRLDGPDAPRDLVAVRTSDHVSLRLTATTTDEVTPVWATLPTRAVPLKAEE